jgi:CBS domain-containing protein
MSSKVVFAAMDHTVDHVRELMAAKHIHALPVVGENQKNMGIVTTTDLARHMEDDQPVRHVMSDMVVMVGATEPASKAAKLMRKHRIHHLVVIDNNKAIGIVSSYDLLKLVEGKTS